jgi:hydroxysqualene synthase
MTSAADLASGKGRGNENFPVASRLIRPELRPTVFAFYRFARLADDVADHPTVSADEKLARLAGLEAGLRGEAGGDPAGAALRAALQERGLTDEHALDLLVAFRRDVTKRRYEDWAELMDYCRYSAAPVGRFMLAVHGESRMLWAANDALCTALQVINHLQDCAKDYRALDRVYIPRDALAARGADIESLGERRASAALRDVIGDLAQRTSALLASSRDFAGQITDRRLALEVGVIQALAESLAARLSRRDPLSQRVHHNPLEMIGLALRGGFDVAVRRLRKKGLGSRASLNGTQR